MRPADSRQVVLERIHSDAEGVVAKLAKLLGSAAPSAAPIVTAMLNTAPGERITASAALESDYFRGRHGTRYNPVVV